MTNLSDLIRNIPDFPIPGINFKDITTLLRDPEQWQIVIPDHHQGYIKWDEFERNQMQLRENTAVEAKTADKHLFMLGSSLCW